MVSLAILARVAFFIALLLTPVVRNFAIGRGWVDTPDHGQVGARKLHRLPISRLGGVAIFAAYAISFVVLINSPLNGARILDHQLGLVARMAPAVLLIFVVGLLTIFLGCGRGRSWWGNWQPPGRPMRRALLCKRLVGTLYLAGRNCRRL